MSASSLLAVSIMMAMSAVLARPQPLADRHAVHARQHDVQQDQVGRLRLGDRQGLFARRHARHLVAFLEEVIAHQLANVFFIFHDQHEFFHGRGSAFLVHRTLREKGYLVAHMPRVYTGSC